MATRWKGKIRIAKILAHQNNWRRYIAWQGGGVRRAVFDNMRKVLLCRTVALGSHLLRLLALEWKLNVIEGIRAVHRKNPLYCRPLRCDPTRRFDVNERLEFIRSHHWHIRLGPSLNHADGAVRYACRYCKFIC